MTNSNLISFIRYFFALFLALQVWVWLRYAGAFWVSDSLYFMESLLKSISPIKATLEGFPIFGIPIVALSHITQTRVTPKIFLSLSVLVGSVISTLYLVTMAPLNFYFYKQQFWVYLMAGSMSGFTYGTILIYPWSKCHQSVDSSTNLLTRRKILGSIGLLAGSTSLVGSLFGPLYYWKNRNTFFDVELGSLEDGQLMTARIANKPVWIIKRSPEVINSLLQENTKLRDPDSKFSRQPKMANNRLRSIRPEYFVVAAICTHLGCLPRYISDNDGSNMIPGPQLFCPCHGGVFDLAGRVYNDTPPPVNMIVPEHEYVSENIVRLHFPSISDQ